MTNRKNVLLGWAAAALLLVQAPATAQDILLIQDNNPWGYSYWYDHLASMGLSYDQVGSSSIATVDLSSYDVVIVPSQQSSSFNSTMNSYMYRFEDYLNGQGCLILMMATYFAYTPISSLPYGATHYHGYGYYSWNMYNVNPSHPIMAGVPASVYSNYSSHGHMENYGSATELTTDDYNDPPPTSHCHSATAAASSSSWK